jgi:hypothetical protein
MSNSSVTGVNLLVIISVFILREVQELLSGAWKMVHPLEGLLLGVVSITCQKDVIYFLQSKVIAK